MAQMITAVAAEIGNLFETHNGLIIAKAPGYAH